MTTADITKVTGVWLEPGDVLVERSNTPELVGTAAMYRGAKDWAIYPDLLIRLRPDRSRMLPEFLELVLTGSRARDYLTSRAKGLSSSMPKIDQPTLASLEVPMPPIEAQRRLLQEWGAVRESLDTLEASSSKALMRSELLRRSLLSVALSGQLFGTASDSDRIEELADASYDSR
jgi:type I restriction enzyme S subunit